MTTVHRILLLMMIFAAGSVSARPAPPLPAEVSSDRMAPVVARAAARSNQWQAAARLWRAVTIAAPADAEAWAGLGAALTQLGLAEDAVAALGRAEALAPGQIGVALNRGRAELALGHGLEAAAAFGVVIRAAPGDPRGWTGLGVARDLLGAHADADAAYAMALTIDPLNVAARHNRQLSRQMALAGTAASASLSPEP